jgi:hypothetical protein
MLQISHFRNLLVNISRDDIQIKVADFGLARYFSPYFKDHKTLDEAAIIPLR